MLMTNSINSFQFENYFVINNYICIIFSNKLFVIININRLTGFTIKTLFTKLKEECILIYPFQKSISQSIVNIIKGFNDKISFLF